MVKKLKLFGKNDKELFGDILLIMGGFLFAETFVRHVLETAGDKIPLWVFVSYSFLLIMGGLNIRRGDNLLFEDIFSLLSLGGALIFIIFPTIFPFWVWGAQHPAPAGSPGFP